MHVRSVPTEGTICQTLYFPATGLIWQQVEFERQGRNISWQMSCCKTVSKLKQATNNQQLLYTETQTVLSMPGLSDTWDELK